MSSLATPWLDLAVACQRHTRERTTYLTARPPFDPSRFGVEPIDTADVRAFIETHHCSNTFPVEIASYGLFESKPNAHPALVGVAVFSIPVNTPAALMALLEPRQTVCDLGRFVLNDHVLANAETWFLTRAYRALHADKTLADGRTPRFPFSTAYSDPCPRPSFDRIIFPAMSASSTRRRTPATRAAPARSASPVPGIALSDRALSKLRADDNGARHVYARLREHGAPALRIGESGVCYLERALIEGPFRRIRHRGNHRYVLLPSCPSLRRKIAAAFPRLPYPKRTDPLPDEAGPLDAPSSADEASDHPDDATVEMGVAA